MSGDGVLVICPQLMKCAQYQSVVPSPPETHTGIASGTLLSNVLNTLHRLTVPPSRCRRNAVSHCRIEFPGERCGVSPPRKTRQAILRIESTLSEGNWPFRASVSDFRRHTMEWKPSRIVLGGLTSRRSPLLSQAEEKPSADTSILQRGDVFRFIDNAPGSFRNGRRWCAGDPPAIDEICSMQISRLVTNRNSHWQSQWHTDFPTC